jgi:hypothetical protein
LTGPVFDLTRSRLKADGMIRRYTGGGGNALLRRVGAPDRRVSALVTGFNPMERIGRLINPVDRKVALSALAPDGSVLSPPPDQEVDRLVMLQVPIGTPPVESQTLRIVQPPGEVAPDGSTVVYYDLVVRA